MKFCQAHWDKLREAVKVRGLWHLVAQNGEQAIENEIAKIEGRADNRNYDPLMSCHWMIVNRALDLGGLYLMTGDYCPICESIKHTVGKLKDENDQPCTQEGEERYWIDGPADAALKHCQEIGLVARKQ